MILPATVGFANLTSLALDHIVVRMGEQIEACILFSDIRDFTEYTAKRGDQQAFDLLQTHNAIAETRIRACGGQVLKTYGDGMMARFDHSIQAVAAARDIQQDFNTHTQHYPDEPLLVGMGLHHGQVIQEESDLFGHTVNLAKRLSDEALSSQILTSRATIDDLSSVKHSFQWRDLGERDLKGIGKERLYEVLWRAEVARLTTKDESLHLVLTSDNNLVIELSKGMQAELDRVQEELKAERVKHTGLARWFLRRMETLVPHVIDWALLRAGVGLEHGIHQVQMSVKEGDLNIRIGNRPTFKIQGMKLDPEEVRQFMHKVETRRRGKP
ncbi:MAG: hypothetical protein A2Z21_00390 [Candidatus Fraserbacteria bacterium RBG_16_55_9]|uniref:Guanylate cyclase domain-containing protein n=1 Tax=Fraserbacteria sp. (strain RBG_16_55_9) TaxID=1817864 RepID=A0A1F5UVQ2_FRAXR|nr:MAG: hypothetical protein A2Z21_00390 [Candidatus Fraserbacteria bacterium RBG_16_55_9]